jgi:hypothetical protein
MRSRFMPVAEVRRQGINQALTGKSPLDADGPISRVHMASVAPSSSFVGKACWHNECNVWINLLA